MSDQNGKLNRDELGALHDFVEALREDTPTETEWAAARNRLLEKLLPSRKENFIMNFLRNRTTQTRWATALTFAVMLVALVMGLNLWDRGPNRVYAAAIEQIRQAQTMTYTILMPMAGLPDQRIEVFNKEPGFLRQAYGSGIYSVIDMNGKKGITVTPALKQYIDIDLTAVSNKTPSINLIDEMRKLPARAEKVLESREMDKHIVQGFQVTELGLKKSIWVDVESGDLVRIEGEFVNAPGMNVDMSDFKFNVELDDSLFSLTPPEGYTRMSFQPTAEEPGEEHLIFLLRHWAAHIQDETFPPSLNPMEMSKIALEMAKSGQFKKDDKLESETAEAQNQKLLQDTMKMTRGYMFVMQLKPESDWRYVGKGVKMGAADTPIFSWKPTGSETYHVIYADLTTKNLKPEDLPPSLKEKSSGQ